MGVWGEPGFVVVVVVRPSVSPKPEFCVKNQAESADDGGGLAFDLGTDSALPGATDREGPGH
jgi:hypothetical protein